MLVGLVAGFLSGLFGVGGGIVMVPALVAVVAMDQRLAHGTSLAAVIPISLAGTFSYLLDGEVDWAMAAALSVGALIGAVIGTHLLQRVAQRALGYAFGALMVLAAVRMVVDHSVGSGRASLSALAVIGLVVTGLLAGTIAGLLGVGGGIVMVPVLVVLYDVPAVLAKGTSLAVIVPTALVGTWRNARAANIDVAVALIAGLTGTVSAFLAGRLSLGLSPAWSNGLFAALLVVAAAKMIHQVRRRPAVS